MQDFSQATPFNQSTYQSHDLYLPNGQKVKQLIPIHQPETQFAYTVITTDPVTGDPQAHFAGETGHIPDVSVKGQVNGRWTTTIQMLPKITTRWLNIYGRYASVFDSEASARQAAQPDCLAVAHRVDFTESADLPSLSHQAA